MICSWPHSQKFANCTIAQDLHLAALSEVMLEGRASSGQVETAIATAT